ncbi:DNA polymerase III subunit gamma and tau [Sinomonas albida]|uniref:DNA polymerase III subunit gamma and tau n=1 Tax=Sinomonas albida TaxID=369942 RepID=UPI003016CE38
MSSPTALYRRYRPDTFQDVIGQEHVTEPLMTALRKDRVNHAYLFSGPRGCGKTTSARILARCLNCEKGPTPEPCGVCPSCVELARGGVGSLDVIEIDAASHGGVDDARDLRERATFAPVRDRYKIFIIDEAHMVTSAGFNALLKIVEEPPEHIKFIFATTEPDKVIGTIRSRTHHYPFRLVPPEPLMAYLEQLCAAEQVPVEPGVLSLVVRAGGGSVRDSLSVLDQLMAGAGTQGIDYELAVALLGYTHAALLDDVVDAVAAGDSATVFRAVDRVIQTGHDPRRFVEDLLERFRDLIIVRALPDAAESILRGVPADQLGRMRTQAQAIGASELSRAADVTNAAFNEMTGATSPRLHLELLCARLMLPAADGDQGLAARLDRLERRMAFGEPVEATAGTVRATPSGVVASPGSEKPAAEPAPERAAQSTESGVPAKPIEPSVASSAPSGEAETTRQEATARPEPAPREAGPEDTRPGSASAGANVRSAPPVSAAAPEASEASPSAPQPAAPAARSAAAAPPPAAAKPAATTPPSAAAPTATGPATRSPSAPSGANSGGSGSVEMFRRAWPEVLEALASIKRLTWILVSQNANVAGFDGRTLTLAFANSGSAGSFSRGDHSDNVRRAVQKVLGADVQIDATTGGNGPSPAAARGAESGPKAPAEPTPRSAAPENAAPQPAAPENAARQPAAPESAAPQSAAPQSAAPQPAEFSAPSDPGRPAPAANPAQAAPREPAAPSAADIAWGLASAPPASVGQSKAEQGTPGPDTAGQNTTEQRTAGQRSAGQGNTGQGTTGQSTTGQSTTGLNSGDEASAGEANADRTGTAQPRPEQTRPGAQPRPEQARPGARPASPDGTADQGPTAGPSAPPPATERRTATRPAAAQERTQAVPASTGPSDPYADIPYGDDEPPADWDEPLPEDEGWRSPSPSRGGQPQGLPSPAPSRGPASPDAAGSTSSEPTGRPGARRPDSGGPDAGEAGSGKTTNDPWAYARESAPGVWTVGSEPNMPTESQGAALPEATSAPEPSSPSYAPAAAQPPARPAPQDRPTAAPSQPPASPQGEPGPAPTGGKPLSMYQRLSQRAAQERGVGQPVSAPAPAQARPVVEDIPSADDETVEDSGLFGRAAVERILGGKLVEERAHDGTVIPPR